MSAYRNLIAVAMFNVWVYFAVSNLLLFQSGISEPEYDIAFSRLLPIFGGFWLKSIGFGLETFAKFLEGLGFGIKKFGIGKKFRFRFQKIRSQKKV